MIFWVIASTALCILVFAEAFPQIWPQILLIGLPLFGAIILWSEDWKIAAELDRKTNQITVVRRSFRKITRKTYGLSALTKIDLEFDNESVEAELMLHFDDGNEVVTLPIHCQGAWHNRNHAVYQLHDDLRLWAGTPA